MADKTIDGVDYDRVYVGEVLPGDITPFREMVESVETISFGVRLNMDNGHSSVYRNRGATILVESRDWGW